MTIRRSRNGKRYDNNAYILDSLWRSNNYSFWNELWNDWKRLRRKCSPERTEEKNKEVEEKKDEGKKGENGKLCAEIK